MRSRLLGFTFLSAALAGLLAGCGTKSPPTGDTKPAANADPGAVSPADVTGVLYTGVAAPVYTGGGHVGRAEPLVIPNCVVQYEDRQSVAAEVDGTIELFATPFKLGEFEKLTADEKGEQVVYHPRDLMRQKPLKRIRESMTVEAGQVIAFLDDQLVQTRMDGALKIKASAVKGREYAEVGVKAAQEKYDATKQLLGTGTGKRDLLDDQITLGRFQENLNQNEKDIAKSEADHQEALVLWKRHQIKSGSNGVIRSIAKRPNEYVKAGEKIMEIEGTDKVRIEGQLGVQYARLVRIGMEVTVEPALPSSPLASDTGHRQSVTGIAVTAHPDGPLVVSVGADGAARVWDPNLGNKPNRPAAAHNLPHPVGVRCVAATPAAARTVLVVTGSDDGKIRIWDVTNRDKLPTAPKVELEEGHTSAVQAIAISPDGRFFATAAGRDVFVWDMAGAKKKYALGLDHRDSVTAVNFTPQGTLVTASKDGTLKVWKLGEDKAAVVRTLDHRAGGIDNLGVSRDGARVLFDQGKGRVDLVDPATGQTAGQLQNTGTAGSFATLAVFAPGEVAPGTDPAATPYTIATAGGDGDLKGALQVWQAARAGGRGSEVARLITPDRSAVTAAAFSPVRGEPFLVVGTADGSVHLWKPPSEARKRHVGRIANIDAADTRYVTVRVEMSNKELQLLDHSIANVIVATDK